MKWTEEGIDAVKPNTLSGHLDGVSVDDARLAGYVVGKDREGQENQRGGYPEHGAILHSPRPSMVS